jgi:hypothetical protein
MACIRLLLVAGSDDPTVVTVEPVDRLKPPRKIRLFETSV